MHLCVTSKNVKWWHLIWPTLYFVLEFNMNRRIGSKSYGQAKIRDILRPGRLKPERGTQRPRYVTSREIQERRLAICAPHSTLDSDRQTDGKHNPVQQNCQKQYTLPSMHTWRSFTKYKRSNAAHHQMIRHAKERSATSKIEWIYLFSVFDVIYILHWMTHWEFPEEPIYIPP